MTMNVFLMTFVRKKTVWRYQMGRQKPKKDRQCNGQKNNNDLQNTSVTRKIITPSSRNRTNHFITTQTTPNTYSCTTTGIKEYVFN